MAKTHIEYILHGDPVNGDLLWFSDQKRKCATCGEIKTLREYYYKPAQGLVSTDCKKCVDGRKAKPETTLAEVIASAAKRKNLLDNNIKGPEAINKIVEWMGGKDRALKLIANSFQRGLRKKDDLELQRKCAVALMDFIFRAEATGDQVNLVDLPEEDQMAALMEPARDLLITNKEFRLWLLEDPAVREALLADLNEPDVRNKLLKSMNVQVLEVKPDA